MKVTILNRLERLLSKMLSLTFITWLIITILFKVNNQPYDLNYLLFTAAIIGLKTFTPKNKESITEK